MRNIKFVLLCLGLIPFVFHTWAQEGSSGFLSDLIQVKKGRSKAVTSSDPDFNSNYDRRTYIKPGETMVLADIKGPAIINHIWLTFNDARPNWLEEYGCFVSFGPVYCLGSRIGYGFVILYCFWNVDA